MADAIDVIYDDVDLSNQCESVDRAGGGAAAAVPALRMTAVAARGRITVRVAVPAPGVVTVRAVSGRLRVGSVSRRAAASGELKLTLRPSRAARRALARRHRLRVTVRVGLRPASGPRPADRSRTVTLRH